MVKAAIGFVLGLAFAAVAWAILGARRPEPRPERASDEKRPDAPATAAAAPDASPDPALASVRAEIAKVEAEIASLKSRPAAPAAKARMTFAELAKKLVPAFAEDSWIWETDDERAQALMGPFLEELRAQAAAKGITLYEAAAGPDGVAALAMAMAAAADPPPDEETMKALEDARAAMGKEFEAYLAKRGSLTRVEQYEQILGIGRALDDLADERLKDTANERWWNANDLWGQSRPTEYLSFYRNTGASLDQVSHDWTDQWSQKLGLDPAQSLALRPIVEEYARAVAELNVEADKTAAQRNGSFINRKEQVSRMIAAQKRIAAELGLSDKQVEALRSMTDVPDHDLRTTR